MDQVELAKIRERAHRHDEEAAHRRKDESAHPTDDVFGIYRQIMVSYVPDRNRPNKRMAVALTERFDSYYRAMGFLQRLKHDYRFPFFDPYMVQDMDTAHWHVKCDLPSWNDVYQSS